ncbi:hypothetical protein [Winogradskyella alexanderae]|uniref:Uncharacterized protein n=1 Tax=Winogradskyella alexanderae TaxID=2877123 RepID=A0ABS7XT87_9FLAO|nr:hypothetical protein [Winogradskyella alexanderae]MCA0132594.1 hypothetical protein [Winogradskyella alexanderae]
MSQNYFYIPFIALVFICTAFFGYNGSTDPIRLSTKQHEYIAGDTITLEFETTGNENAVLYCSNSYGSILLHAKNENNKLTFIVPDSFSKKSGVLKWQLVNTSAPLQGHLTIKPQQYINSIESYLGPPSIEAGGTDYSMLVVIPTDMHDNPLADSTKVDVRHQFMENEFSDEIYTKHGFAYRTIYSYDKKGRIILSTSCLGLNSKEYDINVMPAVPTDFTITAERIHSYADGNQITTFTTSEIKDRYNNTVSDGTFVSFFITDKNGNKTTTSGSTINGIATAKMLHPDHEDQWTIKAYIEGMANSNSILLDYKQAISDFDVALSKDSRTITIGPIQSFMNQRIPDGLDITLKVFKNDSLENTLLEQSYLGYATFKLNQDRYPKGNYHFIIESAGLTKSFNNITYE